MICRTNHESRTKEPITAEAARLRVRSAALEWERSGILRGHAVAASAIALGAGFIIGFSPRTCRAIAKGIAAALRELTAPCGPRT